MEGSWVQAAPNKESQIMRAAFLCACRAGFVIKPTLLHANDAKGYVKAQHSLSLKAKVPSAVELDKSFLGCSAILAS